MVHAIQQYRRLLSYLSSTPLHLRLGHVFIVEQVQCGHRPHVELQAWMRPAGHRNHRRRQIDAKSAQPERVQVCCHAAGAATEIGDRPDTGGLREFGERGKQRTIQWLGRKFSAEELGVVGTTVS